MNHTGSCHKIPESQTPLSNEIHVQLMATGPFSYELWYLIPTCKCMNITRPIAEACGARPERGASGT